MMSRSKRTSPAGAYPRPGARMPSKSLIAFAGFLALTASCRDVVSPGDHPTPNAVRSATAATTALSTTPIPGQYIVLFKPGTPNVAALACDVRANPKS